MTQPWGRGADVIRRYIATGELQQLRGANATGDRLLDQAHTTLASAHAIANSDPRTAVVLAYDAARCAAEGLLAQQGLRAGGTGGSGTEGHHRLVAELATAQFGNNFTVLDQWRRRRNDLSYPTGRNVVDTTEAADAIADCTELIDAATQLMPALGIWR